jgi:hypothetical protein
VHPDDNEELSLVLLFGLAALLAVLVATPSMEHGRAVATLALLGWTALVAAWWRQA